MGFFKGARERGSVGSEVSFTRWRIYSRSLFPFVLPFSPFSFPLSFVLPFSSSSLGCSSLRENVKDFHRTSLRRLFRCLKGYLLRAESYPFARWNVMFWRATAILIDIAKVQQIFETTKYLLCFLHYKFHFLCKVLFIRLLRLVRAARKATIFLFLQDFSRVKILLIPVCIMHHPYLKLCKVFLF